MGVWGAAGVAWLVSFTLCLTSPNFIFVNNPAPNDILYSLAYSLMVTALTPIGWGSFLITLCAGSIITDARKRSRRTEQLMEEIRRAREAEARKQRESQES